MKIHPALKMTSVSPTRLWPNKIKMLYITCQTIIGLAFVNHSQAQMIVGKWQEQTSTEYYTKPDGTENHSHPHPPFDGHPQVLEIKSDQTFTSTEYMNWVPGVVVVSGTWTLSGDQLKTKTNNVSADFTSNVYMMSMSSGTLVLSLKQVKGTHVSRVDKTYKKI